MDGEDNQQLNIGFLASLYNDTGYVCDGSLAHKRK